MPVPGLPARPSFIRRGYHADIRRSVSREGRSYEAMAHRAPDRTQRKRRSWRSLGSVVLARRNPLILYQTRDRRWPVHSFGSAGRSMAPLACRWSRGANLGFAGAFRGGWVATLGGAVGWGGWGLGIGPYWADTGRSAGIRGCTTLIGTALTVWPSLYYDYPDYSYDWSDDPPPTVRIRTTRRMRPTRT